MNTLLLTPRLLIEPPMAIAAANAWATPEERQRAGTFGSERRRREFLTWRAIVRRELGRAIRISYDEEGAPVLPDGEAFVSVSHCPGRVAVFLSPERCAVDIEPADRDFTRAASRFLTPSEAVLADDPRWPGFAWCAKETLYKYAGGRHLDFREDLRILSADLAAGHLTGRISCEPPVSLSAGCRDGFLVVHTL